MIALVGAGPSLASHLNELLALGCPIATTNHTHDYLVANGIKPDIAILTEANHKAHLTPLEDVTYYVRQDAINVPDHATRYPRDWASHDFPMLNVARKLGFSDLHLFGFDSSRDESGTHCDGTFHYGQKEHRCEAGDRIFITNKRWMKQVRVVAAFEPDIELTIYGDNLLAAAARMRPATLRPGPIGWAICKS